MENSRQAPAAVAYRFHPYEVDLARGELRKLGVRIRLERKPWLLLVSLLQRPGELLTRAQLRRALWGEGTFVDFEHGLNVAVKKLRAALCDSPDAPHYIETVAGEGYRFIAAVEVVAVQPPAPASPEPRSHVPDETQIAPAAPPPVGRPVVRKLAWPVTAALVLSAILIVAAARVFYATGSPRPTHSGKVMLVVLPFENLSGDPAEEYLSDGMTEELSSQLGNLQPEQLGVIGRTSAMVYKNAHETVAQIGKALGVDYVLEGSIRRSGDRLRVTAQLIRVDNQAHIWAESYDRPVSELLDVQTDIAANITREVGVSLALDRPAPAAHLPSLEAHDAYLLGRYYFNRRQPGDWQQAAEYFRQAIQADPQYSLAYAGLAECRVPLQEANDAAAKAVELDPASSEAYIALGWVELYRQFDLAAGERSFKRAVELDPNNANAHHSYGEYLTMVGRFDEAIEEKKKAVLLDPLSARYRGAYAQLLDMAGHEDAALQEIHAALQLQPDASLLHESLMAIDLRRGRYTDAIREIQLRPAGHLPELIFAYARSGRRKAALHGLQQMDPRNVSGRAVAEIGLGQNDQAIAALQTLYDERTDDFLLWIKVDPILDPLRGDSRFQDLLKKMNFPK